MYRKISFFKLFEEFWTFQKKLNLSEKIHESADVLNDYTSSSGGRFLNMAIVDIFQKV